MSRFGMVLSAACILLLASCASTQVAEPVDTSPASELRRPGRVLVYDFVGTRDDLPPDSAIAQYYEQPQAPQTQQQIELGRKLGRLVAENIISELKAAGIPAEHAASASTPNIGDGLVRGEFVVVNEGSRTKRVLIGFGAGSGELKTLVEAYISTAEGFRSIGSTQVQAAGGKLPGALVPLGVSASVGSAAVSGTSNILQERGPESLDAAAKRTAKEVARLIIDGYRQRGWL